MQTPGYDGVMDIDALSAELAWWVMSLSLLALIATMVGVPWVVARLPHDYFSEARRAEWESPDRPVTAAIFGLAKNVLGALLVLLGLVMLITPGQGLLTLLMGLLLMNFPGKYRLERWLVMRPGVLRALNWLRRRQGRRPFEDPP